MERPHGVACSTPEWPRTSVRLLGGGDALWWWFPGGTQAQLSPYLSSIVSAAVDIINQQLAASGASILPLMVAAAVSDTAGGGRCPACSLRSPIPRVMHPRPEVPPCPHRLQHLPHFSPCTLRLRGGHFRVTAPGHGCWCCLAGTSHRQRRCVPRPTSCGGRLDNEPRHPLPAPA
jgi:hypothetical protein